MTAGQTDVTLTNQALAMAGTRSKITALNDGTPEADYANLLYGSLRDFMLRQGDPDWAVLFTNPIGSRPATLPWIYAYDYPPNCVRIRNLIPLVNDILNPRAVEWNVLGGPVIVSKVAIGGIYYTNNSRPEADWDAIFEQGFIRLLSSALIFALENRIEASKEKLNEALTMAGIANLRDS